MTGARRAENGRVSWPKFALATARGTIASFHEHRGLALFSLVAAFGIWFFIQDVENPRVRALFPPPELPASIEVEAINIDGLIPNQVYAVRVEVEGREDDLDALGPDDFRATIDVKDIPANEETEAPVKVTALRDGVKVLSVDPPTIAVTLEPLATKEFEVRPNPTGQLATGFAIDDEKREPLTVTVSGLEERVANVASVDLDVNLGALGEGETVIDGELRARGPSGGQVDVTVSPPRGKVTYTVRQSFVQRSLPVAANVVGQVAPGYRAGPAIIEPPLMSVSGPADQMASLTELRTEPIQLGNAKGEIRLVANIANTENQRNLSLERTQVSVRIEVKPIECTAGPATTPCGPVTLQLAPIPENPPDGLVLVNTNLRVFVQLTGPQNVLETITPSQISARVNLAGGQAGPGAFPVIVTIPPALASQGVRAEPVPPMTLTLGPGP